MIKTTYKNTTQISAVPRGFDCAIHSFSNGRNQLKNWLEPASTGWVQLNDDVSKLAAKYKIRQWSHSPLLHSHCGVLSGV